MGLPSSRNYWFWLGILVILMAILAGAFFLPLSSNAPVGPASPATANSSGSIPLKTYRNEQFGFEFQYPADWTFAENSFRSPYSKFNLQGNTSDKNYNPVDSAFLVNIVTPDFAAAQFAPLEKDSVTTTVAGIVGRKYQYNFEDVPNIDIVLPFGPYDLILGGTKYYEQVYNQIISTFTLLR